METATTTTTTAPAPKAATTTDLPDPDAPQTILPNQIQQTIDTDLAQLRAARGTATSGDVDPADDDFGTGAVSGGPVPDRKGALLGGDTGGPALDAGFGLGGAGGSTDPNAGFTDPGPDAAGTPQTSGPEDDPFDDQHDLVGVAAASDTDTDTNDDSSSDTTTASVLGGQRFQLDDARAAILDSIDDN